MNEPQRALHDRKNVMPKHCWPAFRHRWNTVATAPALHSYRECQRCGKRNVQMFIWDFSPIDGEWLEYRANDIVDPLVGPVTTRTAMTP
jgi:hypothetical protein